HVPNGKTCSFCPDRLAVKPDHRDPRFPVRPPCARSRRLDAVRLNGVGAAAERIRPWCSRRRHAFMGCRAPSFRRMWRSEQATVVFAPALHVVTSQVAGAPRDSSSRRLSWAPGAHPTCQGSAVVCALFADTFKPLSGLGTMKGPTRKFAT